MSHPAKQFRLFCNDASGKLAASAVLHCEKGQASLDLSDAHTHSCALMTFPDATLETHRLVLIAPATKNILVDEMQHGFRLPRISILRWSRPAEQLQSAIEERWGIRSIVIDLLHDNSLRHTIVVAEVIHQSEPTSIPRHRWVPLSTIEHDEIMGSRWILIDRLLAGGTTGRGPFSRLGWIEEVLHWISGVTNVDRSQFTRDTKQLNASSRSSLIKVGLKGSPSYWFKASGEGNVCERQITAMLSERFPEFLPVFVASHNDWNAWLMKDSGLSLEDIGSGDSALLEHIARRLAELQRASVVHVEALLACGCDNQRISILRNAIPKLLPFLEEAMTIQEVETVRRIGAARLKEIMDIFTDACFEMEDIGIPDALVHGDINLGNILIDDDRCVFTDWARASVGNPLVTFEHLKLQFAHEANTQTSSLRLFEVYKSAWLPMLSDCQIERAAILVPLIAIAAYLHSRRDWLNTSRRYEPQVQVYTRSLVRQMDRVARELELGHTLCA
jgi:hypothetical protein